MSLKYNDTTDLNGIIQAEESYCELGVAGISGNTNLLKEFTRHNNITMAKIWNWIFQSSGDWKYDDDNQTNLPQATQNLTSGTYKYALPSEALTISGVEYLQAVGGTWTKLKPMTEAEWKDYWPQGEFGKDTGLPEFYMIKGNTIILDLIPNITVANGLKVYFDRGSVAFAPSDTTKSPGFASEYHNAVAVGGAIEWLKVHKPNSAVLTLLFTDWKQYEQDIKNFYASRFKDYKPPRMTARITEFH